jgi:hypothetical protein
MFFLLPIARGMLRPLAAAKALATTPLKTAL